MKAPAFQLYVSDFYLDTAGWTATEVGVYLRLLLYQWAEGPLPNDLNVLTRIAGVDRKTMGKFWLSSVGKKFIQREEGTWENSRLEKTRQNQLNYSESQRERANIRWQKNNASASIGDMPNGCSPSPTPSPTKKHIKEPKPFASNGFDAWWQKYPHRNGKRVTKGECVGYLKGIKFVAWDDLMQATENYSKSDDVKNGYAKDPVRFVKKEYWKDWIQMDMNPTEQESEDVKAITEKIRKIKEGKDVIN